MTHAGQSVAHPSGCSDWLQSGHVTQAEPIRVPSWEFIWAKGSGKPGSLDGVVCPHTCPPQLQPHGEPFLRRKEGGQHIRRQQNQDLS